MQDSSSSSNSCQEEIANLVYKTVQNSQFSMNLDYVKGAIQIKFNFQSVEAKNSTFFRHVVIIYNKYFTKGQIEEIISKYFRMLKLGDFMIVYIIEPSIKKSKWVQKTNSNESESNIFKKCTKDQCSKEYFQRMRKRYPQYISTCIFSKDSNQSYQKLINQKITEGVNSFYIRDNAEIIEKQSIKSTYITKFTQLSNRLKEYFHKLYKIRVKTAQIKLKSLNAVIDLRVFSHTTWRIDDKVLIKDLYGLNNSQEYQERLTINTVKSKLEFEIQFQVINIQNEIFFMRKCFTLQPDENTPNTCSILQKHKVKQSEYYYSSAHKLKNYGDYQQKIVMRSNMGLADDI